MHLRFCRCFITENEVVGRNVANNNNDINLISGIDGNTVWIFTMHWNNIHDQSTERNTDTRRIKAN